MLKAPRNIVEWVKNGVPLKWAGTQPKEPKCRQSQDQKVEQEMEKLIEEGAFVLAPAEMMSSAFVILERLGTYTSFTTPEGSTKI